VVRVHGGLNVGEQLRDPVHLVENCSTGMLSQQRAWIPPREVLDIGRLQGDVGFLGENGPAQGRLARLARSRDGHDGELSREGPKAGFENSLDHGGQARSDGADWSIRLSLSPITFEASSQGPITAFNSPLPCPRRVAPGSGAAPGDTFPERPRLTCAFIHHRRPS